jgi:hypothetical protein
MGWTSHDGWIHCSRDELAGGIDAGADALYAHKPTGECRCGQTHGEQLEEPGIEAVYEYRSATGAVLFQVVRKPGKKFLQRKPDGHGRWLWRTAGMAMVLYRWPELAAADPDRLVWIVEGEKDADVGAVAGLLTTCNPRGAGKWRALEDHARDVLAGRDVVVLADKDEPGRAHAQQVAVSLRGHVRSLRVWEVPGEAKDLAAYLGSGGTVDELLLELPMVLEEDVVRLQVAVADPANDDEATHYDPDAPDVDPDEPPALEKLDEMFIQRVLGGLLDGHALAKELPPLEYICAAIGMTAGKGPPHMVAGYGFSGKTVALQAMALQLAAGRSVWGAYTGRGPLRVLHVDEEQGQRLTQRRYQRLALAMGLDLPELLDTLAVSPMAGLRLDNPNHAPAWEAIMRGRDAMIVDSLRVVQPSVEENSSEFRRGLDMLGRLSALTGCRAVVIHHARKSSNDKPNGGIESIRGSGAILDACDSVYVFSASKGEPVAVEAVKTREHGEPPPDFALKITDVASEDGADRCAGLAVNVYGMEAVQEVRAEKARVKERQSASNDADRIREQIRVRPGISTRELKAAVGLNGVRLASGTLALGDEVETKDELRAGHWVTRCYLRGVA